MHSFTCIPWVTGVFIFKIKEFPIPPPPYVRVGYTTHPSQVPQYVKLMLHKVSWNRNFKFQNSETLCFWMWNLGSTATQYQIQLSYTFHFDATHESMKFASTRFHTETMSNERLHIWNLMSNIKFQTWNMVVRNLKFVEHGRNLMFAPCFTYGNLAWLRWRG